MGNQKVEYVHRRTDSEVRLLHKKGAWNEKLEELSHDKKQLGALQRLLKHFYWYETARLRKVAAQSEIERHKKQILANYPVGVLPGFIARRGRQWLRNLVITPEPTWVIKDPAGFVDHLGTSLPQVASRVHVSLTPDEFLYLRVRYAKSYPERQPLRPIAVEADQLALDKLVLLGKIKPLPDGMTDFATKEPTLRVSFIKDPS